MAPAAAESVVVTAACAAVFAEVELEVESADPGLNPYLFGR
jgi:hypothetical protein